MQGLLQHWTESSKILTSRKKSVWRNKRPRSRTVSFEKDRSFTWSTSTSGSLVPMILSSIMQGIRFEMGRNFVINDENPNWWHLGKLVQIKLLESGKLKTVLELYHMGIHQKKAGPDYHRLKTMVKRSTEQNLRMKNFEARNGHFETSAVVKNQRVKQAWTKKSRRLLAMES